MQEVKRAQILTSVPPNHARMNGLLNIETAEIPKQKQHKSHRFVLELFQSDDKKFPEFNYQTLLKNVTNHGNNGDNSNLLEEDDTDQLKALAKKIEEKYGPTLSSSKKKSRKHIADFFDIGYGYDESDTFLDNTEAYDEVVPSDWTTEYGGFYINQGNLDFRPISSAYKDIDKSILNTNKKKKKKKMIDKKLSKTPQELSTHKKKKQLLSKEKQRKKQESLIKAQKILAKKKKKKNITVIDDSSQDVPLLQLSKSLEDDMPLSKIAKSSLLSDDSSSIVKNSVVDDDLPLSKIIGNPLVKKLKASTEQTTTSQVLKTLTSTKSVENCTSVLKEQISSVLKISTSNSSQNSENNVKTPVKIFFPLPEGLAPELLDDVTKLKGFAPPEAGTTKGKYFTPEVNNVLLSFARKCRLLPPKLRNGVYDHILFYLPCAKDTLVKRCRALVVKHQRNLEDEPMKLLQEAIDASMPAQKRTFDEEVAKALQEQAREQIKQTGIDPKKSDESNGNTEDKSKKNFPRKKFIWSEELRKLLCNVVQVRVGLYKMSKSRSMTAEEYIKDFFESEIRKMWPKGWMTSRILYKETRAAHSEITQPLAKVKKAVKKDESIDTNGASRSAIPIDSVLKVSSAVKIDVPSVVKVNALSTVTVTVPLAVKASVLSAVNVNTPSIMKVNLPSAVKVNTSSKNLVLVNTTSLSDVKTISIGKTTYNVAAVHHGNQNILKSQIYQRTVTSVVNTTSSQMSYAFTNQRVVHQPLSLVQVKGTPISNSNTKYVPEMGKSNDLKQRQQKFNDTPTFVNIAKSNLPVKGNPPPTGVNVSQKQSPHPIEKSILVSSHKRTPPNNQLISLSTPRTPLNSQHTPSTGIVLDSSPKVSPYIATPTFIRTCSINAHQSPTKSQRETPTFVQPCLIKAEQLTPTFVHKTSTNNLQSPYVTTAANTKVVTAVSSQVKRKSLTHPDTEHSLSQKRPVPNILDYRSPQVDGRTWSEVESDLARLSHGASINRSTPGITPHDWRKGWQSSSGSSHPRYKFHSTHDQATEGSETQPLNHISHKAMAVTKSVVVPNMRVPEFPSGLLCNMTPSNRNLQHRPHTSPNHQTRQSPSSNSSMMPPQKSPRISAHIPVSSTNVSNFHPTSVPIDGNNLEFNKLQHPSARMHHAVDRNYSPQYLASGKTSEQALLSHSTVNLMNEIHRTHINPTPPSMYSNQGLLHIGQHCMSEASHILPPSSQRNLSVEQQLEILQKEYVNNRNNPDYSSKFADFAPHFQ